MLLNEKIEGENFRLVEGGGNSRIVSREEMFSIARQKGLDLLLVNNKIDPPVVKLLNYEEFVQESKKATYKASKKAKSNVSTKLKSIALKLKIDNHDLGWKVKKAREWLSNGEKVQLIIKTPFEESETKSTIANNLFKKFSELVVEEGRAFENLKQINQAQYSAIFVPIEIKKE